MEDHTAERWLRDLCQREDSRGRIYRMGQQTGFLGTRRDCGYQADITQSQGKPTA